MDVPLELGRDGLCVCVRRSLHVGRLVVQIRGRVRAVGGLAITQTGGLFGVAHRNRDGIVVEYEIREESCVDAVKRSRAQDQALDSCGQLAGEWKAIKREVSLMGEDLMLKMRT